jgi:drug/metabolite transporter (DMT)-like permease
MASAGGAHEDHAVAGYALAILGAACAAGYFLIGRHLRIGLPLSRYVGIVYPMAGVMLAALALVSQQPLAGFEPRTYLMLGLLALVPQLIGHSALNWSLRYLPAAVVTVAVLGEPVGATALAAIVLGEVPTLQEASGAGIVLVGVWVALTGGRSGQASRVAVAEDAHPCPAPHHSRRHLFRRRF